MQQPCLWILGILLDFHVLVNLVGCSKTPKIANKYRGLLMLTPASTDHCVYGTYTIQVSMRSQLRLNPTSSRTFTKPGDTCESVASSHSLSLDQLIAINGLDVSCGKLPAPGEKICLSGSCPLYHVNANDTCLGIYQTNSISWSQLLAWNPYVPLPSCHV